jgi:hypothetical protein
VRVVSFMFLVLGSWFGRVIEVRMCFKGRGGIPRHFAAGANLRVPQGQRTLSPLSVKDVE